MPSHAYVLQGPHILDLMTQKLGGAKTLMVSQILTIYGTQGPQSAVELKETLKYVFPETFRSDIRSDNIETIHVRSDGEAVTVVDGRVSANPETPYNRYKDILLYHSRALLQNRLEQLGVDVSVSSLGRFQGNIAFVLGSEYPDENRHQIWIEKDTLVPLRWILPGKDSENSPNSNDKIEIRYLDWKQIDHHWYPMRIAFYQSDVLAREIRVDTIEVNPSFSKEAFDIDRLKSAYRPEIPVVPDPNKPGALNEVQQTIEEFKKRFE
jgi:hypothetical protein